MGEYIRAEDTAGNVHDIKIGVCEELYRIRRRWKAEPELAAILKRIIDRATAPMSNGGIDDEDVKAARAVLAKAGL